MSASRVVYSRWNGTGWTSEYLFDDWSYKMPLDVSHIDADIARPSIFATTGDRVFVIYRNNVDSGRMLRVREVTDGGGSSDSDSAVLNVDLYAYEPTFDSRAVRDRDEPHILVTPVRSADTPLPEPEDLNWTAQPVGILTVDLLRIDAILDGTANVPSAIQDTITHRVLTAKGRSR